MAREGQVFLPFRRSVKGINDIMAGGWGLEWLPQEFHPGFLGRATRFALIASLAGTDYVIPAVLTIHMAWDHMV
jgi:hypothetical protein